MLAAIDCGTNSTRLLVSEDGTRTIERLMRITRLGQGVDATGALAPEAVKRTLD
ncbi:MAG: exopolyphosphatase, partial [Acidimicrobiia bacterium]|nr:exopolyphosphatase [Acidimicrobiia bacterium]